MCHNDQLKLMIYLNPMAVQHQIRFKEEALMPKLKNLTINNETNLLKSHSFYLPKDSDQPLKAHKRRKGAREGGKKLKGKTITKEGCVEKEEKKGRM